MAWVNMTPSFFVPGRVTVSSIEVMASLMVDRRQFVVEGNLVVWGVIHVLQVSAVGCHCAFFIMRISSLHVLLFIEVSDRVSVLLSLEHLGKVVLILGFVRSLGCLFDWLGLGSGFDCLKGLLSLVLR